MPDILIATPSQLLALLRRGAGAGAGAGAGGKAKGGAASAAAGVQLRDSLHTLIIDEADLLLSYGYGEQTSVAQYSCRKLVSSHTSPNPNHRPRVLPLRTTRARHRLHAH